MPSCPRLIALAASLLIALPSKPLPGPVLAGTYSVEVGKSGFQATRREVAVRDNSAIRVDVISQSRIDPIALKIVNLTPIWVGLP
jgi:hypothetical protein